MPDEKTNGQGGGESKFEKAMEAMTNTMRAEQDGNKPPEREDKTPPPADKPEGDKKPADEAVEGKEDWAAKYKELEAQKAKETEGAMSQVEEMARERIEQDAEYIHTLAQKNRPLADKLVKEALSAKGINSYDELVQAVKKSQMSDESKKVLDEMDPVKKKVEELDKKMLDREKAEAERYLSDFRTNNPEFKGEIEKKTWEFFNKHQTMTLEESFDYIKYKHGIKEDENQREERAYRNIQQKNSAGSIPAAGRPISKGSRKSLSQEEIAFLEGVGAKKTLQKYGA